MTFSGISAATKAVGIASIVLAARSAPLPVSVQSRDGDGGQHGDSDSDDDDDDDDSSSSHEESDHNGTTHRSGTTSTKGGRPTSSSTVITSGTNTASEATSGSGSAATPPVSSGTNSSSTSNSSASQTTGITAPTGTQLVDRGVSRGAVAGIVIGVLLLLALVLPCFWWLCRRRRTNTVVAGSTTEVKASEMRNVAPSSDPRRSTSTLSSMGPTAALLAPRSYGGAGGMPYSLRNLPAGGSPVTPPPPNYTSTDCLPNPYEQPLPPVPPHNAAAIDRSMSTSPASPISPTTPLTGAMFAPAAASHPPSTWHTPASSEDTSDMYTALLSREQTVVSRASTGSAMHTELAGYQKHLEASLRKTEEDSTMGRHMRVTEPLPRYPTTHSG